MPIIEISKIKLTRAEIAFVNRCLDVFEASGWTGLYNHVARRYSGRGIIRQERYEVLTAIAQSIAFDTYVDELGVESQVAVPFCLNLVRMIFAHAVIES